MVNMSRFNEFKCFLIILTLCYLARPVLSDCLNAPIENFDYFPNKISSDNDDVNGIRDFDVTYGNRYIIVKNNKAHETYILYCEATQPVGTDIPVNITRYIQVPVTNVAVHDRAALSFIEILGEERKLKYVGDKSAITSPCLQKHNDLYETVQFSNTTEIESIDVIFTGTPALLPGGKFVTVSMDENTEALKRAEWIKFVSLFFNKTDVANEAFSKIQSNYLCHTDNVSKVPVGTKKSIAWVYHESDTFIIESGLFYRDVTFDAAALPLPLLSTMRVSTTEELHQIIDDAYIVIDMSDLVASNDTLDSWKRIFGYQTSTDLPNFLTQKRLFRTRRLLNKMAYDDWTETSPSRPDLVLQDLIAIQYPSYQKDYNVTWLERFAAGTTGDAEIISEEQCNEDTFGWPKTDFGTCVPTEFTGVDENDGSKVPDDEHHDDDDNHSKKKVNPGIIIAGALIGSLIGVGLGAWLFIVARRKYRERFVKLRDEHESQSVN